MVCALAAVLLLALVTPRIAKMLLFHTQFPSGFSRREFSNVRSGDSIESVIQKLGLPLKVFVRTAHDPEQFEEVTSFQVRPNSTDVLHATAGKALLRYSQPVRKSSFVAYEIWITSNRVEKVRVFDYWD
jgi:hypothetical protein